MGSRRVKLLGSRPEKLDQVENHQNRNLYHQVEAAALALEWLVRNLVGVVLLAVM